MIHRTAMDLKMPWMAKHGGISNMHPEKAHKIVLIFYISVNFGFINRHVSLLNVNAAGACGYDFLSDGGRLVRAYVRLRRGAI